MTWPAPDPKLMVDEDGFIRDDKWTLENDYKHRHGVSWMDAPLPPKKHKCRAQTKGYVRMFDEIKRCACGATWIQGGWTGVNERRRDG
jgi:hypothetical protein